MRRCEKEPVGGCRSKPYIERAGIYLRREKDSLWDITSGGGGADVFCSHPGSGYAFVIVQCLDIYSQCPLEGGVGARWV